MKKTSLKSVACFLGCAAILTACGGSTDDEAGAPAALVTVPAELEVTSADDTCGGIGDPTTGVATSVAKVFIKGGTAPYRVESSAPGRVVVSPSRVLNRDEGFDVFLLGGCVNPAQIVVTDSLNAFTTFEMTYEADGAT